MTTVAGQRGIQVNPTILLKNEIHVPKLSTNMIFNKKLTNDLSCDVIFTIILVYCMTRNLGGRLDILESEIVFSIWET